MNSKSDTYSGDTSAFRVSKYGPDVEVQVPVPGGPSFVLTPAQARALLEELRLVLMEFPDA
jgi:hypothetical protein